MKIEGNSKNSKEYKIQANKNILYFNFLICFIFEKLQYDINSKIFAQK